MLFLPSFSLPGWIASLASTAVTHWRAVVVCVLIAGNIVFGHLYIQFRSEAAAAAARAAAAETANLQLLKARDSLALAAGKAEAEKSAADSALLTSEHAIRQRIVYVAKNTLTDTTSVTGATATTSDSTPLVAVPVTELPEVRALIKSANDAVARSDTVIAVLKTQLAVDDSIIVNDSTQLAAIPQPKRSTTVEVIHATTSIVASAAIGAKIAGPIGAAGGVLVGAVLWVFTR
jgi:hypothetical protein